MAKKPQVTAPRTNATSATKSSANKAQNGPKTGAKGAQGDTIVVAAQPNAAPAAIAVVAAPQPKVKFGVAKTARTRPYYAGRVFAQFGLAAGVTGEMAQKLDEMYGTTNMEEALGRLRNAYHAIRGFCDEHGLDPATGKRLPAAK